MAVNVTKTQFKKNFPLILDGINGDEITNVIDTTVEIPDKIWNTITYLAEIYISADGSRCSLSDNLREKGIYLTIAVFLLKTINNFILRKNGSHMTSAREGEVSVSYQDIPATSVKDWFLTDPSVQPFGMMLYQILQLVQPCISVNFRYPVPYYNAEGWYDF